MRKASFTKASVIRAVEAVKAAGVEVGIVEIDPDGKIRIIRAVAETSEIVTIPRGVKRWAG